MSYLGKKQTPPGCNRHHQDDMKHFERIRDSNQMNLHLHNRGFARIQTDIPHRKHYFQGCFFVFKKAGSTTTPSRVGMNLFQQTKHLFCFFVQTRMELRSLFFLMHGWIFWPQFPTWYRRRFPLMCHVVFSKELDHVISHTPQRKNSDVTWKKGPMPQKEKNRQNPQTNAARISGAWFCFVRFSTGDEAGGIWEGGCNCKHRGGSWLWRTRSRKSSLWLLGMPRGFGDWDLIFVTPEIFLRLIFFKLARGFRWKTGWHWDFC